MSISNRHHYLSTLKNRKWTLVIYDPQTDIPIFYLSTINNLKTVADEIFIYCRYQSLDQFKTLESVRVFETLPSKISIMEKLLDNGKNILWFENRTGYLSMETINYFDDINDIYGIFLSNLDKSYVPFLEKFRLPYIISTSIMIVPYHPKNHQFLKNAFHMCKQIMSNETFALNLSITINNVRSGGKVKKLQNLPFNDNFVLENDDKKNSQTIKEILKANGEIYPVSSLFFDDTRYMYYPYLDVSTDNISYCFDPDNLPQVYNTNGFTINTKNEPVFSLFFKRFNNKNFGVFVKKNDNKEMIPRILHCLNFNTTDQPTNFIKEWGRILRKPWEYRVWTVNDMNNEFKESKWFKAFENAKSTKYLLAALMILEKFGGIAVDSYVMPLRIIPDEILKNYFLVSFLDEKNFGTKLSFRLIASVPGKLPETEQIVINYDAARRPFEGINNFFRNVRHMKNYRPSTPETNNIYPAIFNKLYNTLSNDNTNSLDNVQSVLLSDPKVTVYPSYYFNPNICSIPECLAKNAICSSLWLLEEEDEHIKTNINRQYLITKQGIIIGLHQNPKDRLRNQNIL